MFQPINSADRQVKQCNWSPNCAIHPHFSTNISFLKENSRSRVQTLCEIIRKEKCNATCFTVSLVLLHVYILSLEFNKFSDCAVFWYWNSCSLHTKVQKVSKSSLLKQHAAIYDCKHLVYVQICEGIFEKQKQTQNKSKKQAKYSISTCSVLVLVIANYSGKKNPLLLAESAAFPYFNIKTHKLLICHFSSNPPFMSM